MFNAPVDPLTAIAVHESGHAVVAVRLGLRCGGVRIDPDAPKGVTLVEDAYVRAHYWDAAGYGHVVRSAFTALIIVEMAGAESEDILCGSRTDGNWRDDLFAKFWATGYLEVKDWNVTEPRMRRATRRLVRRHRLAIERVADALTARRVLNPHEIDALIFAPA